MSDVVQKLWGFCHTLRHDGIDYGDYIEQITFLLFLKMADERAITLPKGWDWPALRDRAGPDLLDHYTDTLRTLGRTPGILGDIYAEAQSRFNNAVRGLPGGFTLAQLLRDRRGVCNVPPPLTVEEVLAWADAAPLLPWNGWLPGTRASRCWW